MSSNIFHKNRSKNVTWSYVSVFMTNIEKPCLWLASWLSVWLPAQPGRFTCLYSQGVSHAEELRMANRRLIPA
jgi:hypothetical protein